MLINLLKALFSPLCGLETVFSLPAFLPFFKQHPLFRAFEQVSSFYLSVLCSWPL